MEEDFSGCGCGAAADGDAGLVPGEPEAVQDKGGGEALYRHLAEQAAGQGTPGAGGEGAVGAGFCAERTMRETEVLLRS